MLIPQAAAFEHLDACMEAIGIPCGIYNNPARLGVQVRAETIKKLSDRHPHFVVDKETTGDVGHLVEVQRLSRGKVKIMCCDMPKYSVVLPTLAIGGTGTANIGGNIIPEETALFSRPWTTIERVNESREGYLKWVPLLQELYTFSNPIVIKAELDILGLPGGNLRALYRPLGGSRLSKLEKLLNVNWVLLKNTE